ncbi:MAG: hypothetical protein HYS26_03435 [Candidatus Kaiserbacteria bacterium]|nr:MAG: hypothetical protein HYS26_03435 [Candidatus Kaiserbacteria bacterium]
MWCWCERPNINAVRIAKAIRDGKLLSVTIEPRMRPGSNPRQAYPTSVTFIGQTDGREWTMLSKDGVIEDSESVPLDMQKLFLRVVHGQTGEGIICAAYLRRKYARLGLELNARGVGQGFVQVTK